MKTPNGEEVIVFNSSFCCQCMKQKKNKKVAAVSQPLEIEGTKYDRIGIPICSLCQHMQDVDKIVGNMLKFFELDDVEVYLR